MPIDASFDCKRSIEVLSDRPMVPDWRGPSEKITGPGETSKPGPQPSAMGSMAKLNLIG